MTNHLHLVMHAAAIKRNGQIDDIASIAGLDKRIVRKVLEKAVLTGRLVQVDETYLLSSAGRMILDSEYSRFCGDIRANDDFIKAYEKFEDINRRLKQLITDWQTIKVGGQIMANDHSDTEYDDKVIDRLGDIQEIFEPILQRLCVSVNRLSNYQSKLLNALEKAEDGDKKWVSDAQVESYHTVWFELHEDLLRLLDQTREE